VRHYRYNFQSEAVIRHYKWKRSYSKRD